MDIKQVNWWKIGGLIALGIALFLVGIYIGKKTTKPKEITHTEYITLPPIHDTIPPIIIKEKVPVDTAKLIKKCVKDGIYQELFPEKIVYLNDTTQFTKPDSTKIMLDWATEREYAATLFEIDTVGTCIVNTKVQYNRLGRLNYTFTPVEKQTTTELVKTRKYLPYIGGGITTFPSVSLETGLFIDQSWGFAIDGNYFFNPNKIENMPKYNVGIKVLKMF